MRHRWIAWMTCITLAAAYAPMPAAAQAGPDAATVDVWAVEVAPALEDGEIERWDWEKFWSYAACGAAIALATGGAGVVAAVIACGRVLSLYWTT